jgi:chromosome segregation ATPase
LGSEISSRLETEKHWFAVNTKKDFENKVTATEKTVEELMQRLQWIYESLDKSKNDLKEKENDIKLILQEREKLLLRLSDFKKKLEALRKKLDVVYADDEGPPSVTSTLSGYHAAPQTSPHSQSSDDDKETP